MPFLRPFALRLDHNHEDGKDLRREHAAILEAADNLLVERGSTGLTVKGIRYLLPSHHGVGRGELSQDFDVEAATEELLSPIYYRTLVSGQRISPAYVDRLVRCMLLRIERSEQCL